MCGSCLEKLLSGDGSEHFLRKVLRNFGMGLETGLQPLLVFNNGFQLISLLLEVMLIDVKEFGEVLKGAMEGQLPFDIGVGVRFL